MMLLLEMEGLARTADNSGNAVIVVCPLCGWSDVNLFLSGVTLSATHQPKQEQASKIEKPESYSNSKNLSRVNLQLLK